MLARSSLFAALSLGLVACDGTPATPDAGPEPVMDAGSPDGGPPLACTDLETLEAELDGTVSVMLDTTMTETRPRDLGLSCGNTEAELRWARQEVVELHIPDGAGQVAVEIDTALMSGTDATFNTLVQVRRSCEEVPLGIFPPTCFDDASADEIRARGTVTANGGETLYVIVTGYSEPPAESGTMDEGRVRVDFTVTANAAPTLTGGALLLALDDSIIQAQGNDPDGDARGVALNFYGPEGELLDIYGDGEATEDGDVFIVFFDTEPSAPDYDATATVPGAEINLAGYLRNVMATGARLRVFDAGWAASAPMMVSIDEAELVGAGEVCDSTHVCRQELSCVAGTCEAGGDVAAACAAATDLAVTAPTDSATTVTVTGSSGAGEGDFAPDPACVAGESAATLGDEAIYAFTVPAGTTVDLLATTNTAGTGETDTILYARSACADRGTELDCNDDIMMGELQSEVEARDLTEGTYYLFVESYGGLSSGTAAHELTVTLRPVLATGAACDDAGVDDRCAAGACSTGVCP